VGRLKGRHTRGLVAARTVLRAFSAANPLHGRIAIGTYAYHAGGEDFFGDKWDWNLANQFMQRNHWHCLEQHLRMNTPAAHDGIVEAWIDRGACL
jgi:hypothetical protein